MTGGVTAARIIDASCRGTPLTAASEDTMVSTVDLIGLPALAALAGRRGAPWRALQLRTTPSGDGATEDWFEELDVARGQRG